MNPQTKESHSNPPAPGTPPASPNPTAPAADNAPDEQAGPVGDRRHTGKVARLAKEHRDKVNIWLRDGVPYTEIITRLGEAGVGLTIGNISEWKKRGHQDWLVEQAFLERTRIRQDSVSDLGHDYDATGVNHAALQLGSLHIFEALRDLGPGSLDQKLGGDPATFARLLNCLARISKETMLLQKYRDACAKARTAIKPSLDPKRKFTDAENRDLVRRVDELLGIVSPDAPETQNPDLRHPTPPPSDAPPTSNASTA